MAAPSNDPKLQSTATDLAARSPTMVETATVASSTAVAEEVDEEAIESEVWALKEGGKKIN